MRTEPPPAEADAAGELVHPGYWLVFGLEWPGSEGAGAGAGGVAEVGVAEAAVAVPPAMIPRDALGHDAQQVLGCADLYARKHAERVVFFSDLTRMLTSTGTSWAELGVDWENALRELREGPFPAMFLTISERAHLLICDPTTDSLTAGPGGWADEGGAEREIVRQAIAGQLALDWPPWTNAMIEARRIRRARSARRRPAPGRGHPGRQLTAEPARTPLHCPPSLAASELTQRGERRAAPVTGIPDSRAQNCP